MNTVSTFSALFICGKANAETSQNDGFIGREKWFFDPTASLPDKNQYYICNVAMAYPIDPEHPEYTHCIRTLNEKSEEMEDADGNKLYQYFDPVVLTFVPNDLSNPQNGGKFEFRKVCDSSCEDPDIIPEYQKFKLYRKS